MELSLKQKQVRRISGSFVLSLFLAGIFMGALDHGIVGPALSSIIAAYMIDESWAVWSFTIYTLLFGVSIPLMGKLSDRFGRKRIFMIGIFLFGAGSLLAAFSPAFWMFLAGRAIQAIETGGIFPITAPYIAVTFSEETRAKALGWIGVVFGLGTILGPGLGGLIIEHTSWKWIFLINVPISALILLLMSRVSIPQPIVEKPIDYKGIVTLTTVILTGLLSITLKNGLLLLAAVIAAVLLVMFERRAQDPIVNLSYFTKRNTLFILLLSLTSGFIMASAINLLPFFLETKFEVSKGAAAAGTIPLAAASMIASLTGGQLAVKRGPKQAVLIGFIITAAGTLLFTAASNFIIALAVNAVTGFGIGIIIGAPLNMLMIQAVEKAETGAAVGFLSLFRSIGSTLGPAAAGMLLVNSGEGIAAVSLLLTIVSLISISVVLGTHTMKRV